MTTAFQTLQNSLRWAERGLRVYGGDAARPEAVEDLKKRVKRARSKLPRE